MAECMSAACYEKEGEARRGSVARPCAMAGRRALHTSQLRHSPVTGPCPLPAFDGSPISCYCLWVDVPAGQAYTIGSRNTDEPVSCEQPEGFAISGEYTESAAFN